MSIMRLYFGSSIRLALNQPRGVQCNPYKPVALITKPDNHCFFCQQKVNYESTYVPPNDINVVPNALFDTVPGQKAF